MEYFTNALGPALTHEAAVGWTNFLDLMIEVVKETAKGEMSKFSMTMNVNLRRNPLSIYM